MPLVYSYQVTKQAAVCNSWGSVGVAGGRVEDPRTTPLPPPPKAEPSAGGGRVQGHRPDVAAAEPHLRHPRGPVAARPGRPRPGDLREALRAFVAALKIKQAWSLQA